MNGFGTMRHAAALMDTLATDMGDGERYADLYDGLIALIEDTLNAMAVPGHAWAGETYPDGRRVHCACGRQFDSWTAFVDHVTPEATDAGAVRQREHDHPAPVSEAMVLRAAKALVESQTNFAHPPTRQDVDAVWDALGEGIRGSFLARARHVLERLGEERTRPDGIPILR